MTYLKWFDTHGAKHKKIVNKLVAKNYSKEQIIDYFEFENMVKNENDFCLLYQEPKKCHEMEHLNCYLCACPHFRFNDEGLYEKEGLTIYSECSIAMGEIFTDDSKVHHDCSNCIIPHKNSYVKKSFEIEWKNIMKQCSPKKISNENF